MSLNGSMIAKDASGRLMVGVLDVDVPAGFNGGTPMTAAGALAITSASGAAMPRVAGLLYDAAGRLSISGTGPAANWVAGLPVDSLGRLFASTANPAYWAPNGIPITAGGAVSMTGTGGAADFEAPTNPTGLLATVDSYSQITLNWNPSTDNVGVAGYSIERCAGLDCVNFGQIGTSVTPSFVDSGLSNSTVYRYRVLAYDAATNMSGYSNVAEGTTQSIPGLVIGDTVAATEALETLVGKVVADIAAASESTVFASVKALADSLVASESFAWLASMLLQDQLTAVDAAALMVGKQISEVALTADTSLTNAIGMALSDDSVMTDSPSFSGSGGLTPSDNSTGIDALSWLMSTFKSDDGIATDIAALMASKDFLDSVNMTEALTELLTKVLTDAVTSTDVMNNLMDRISGDTAAGADAITHSVTTSGPFSDDGVATDNFVPVLTPGDGANPADLFAAGELGGWWDPSDFSTMWQDSARTTPVTAAGQPVGAINDKSGRNNHFTQATAASRPTLQQDGSGKWYLNFDGSDDGMATASINLTTVNKIAVWAGAYRTTTTPTGTLVELSNNSASTNGTFYLQVPGASPWSYFWRVRGTADPQMQVQGHPTPQLAVLVATGDIPADAMKLRVNGLQTTTPVNAPDIGTGNFSNNILYMGRRGGTTLPMTGRVYGLIVRGTTTATTEADVMKYEQWMAGQTGAVIGIVQTSAPKNFAQSRTASITLNNVKPGNSIIVMSAVYTGSDPAGSPNATVSDGVAYTLAARGQSALSAGKNDASIHYRHNHPGGTVTVTVSNNPAVGTANSYGWIQVLEVAGLVNAAPNQTANNSGQSTTPTSGTTAATTAANCLVLAALSCDDAPTAASIDVPATTGYTNMMIQQNASAELAGSFDAKYVSATGTQSAAWGTMAASYRWGACIAAFALS